jgi:cytochrome c biogenesis protein CcdA
MTLELAAVPLALMAGVFGVLSPCVWPLVPVVTSSAAVSGRSGPFFLAAGLSVSFALAGTVLSWLLVSTGLDPELFRYMAAGLLVAVAGVLLVPALGDRITLWLSSLAAGRGPSPGRREPGAVSAPGQFGVGALLGFVWLPCVGPTLGAAIALASMGQSLPLGLSGDAGLRHRHRRRSPGRRYPLRQASFPLASRVHDRRPRREEGPGLVVAGFGISGASRRPTRSLRAGRWDGCRRGCLRSEGREGAWVVPYASSPSRRRGHPAPDLHSYRQHPKIRDCEWAAVGCGWPRRGP